MKRLTRAESRDRTRSRLLKAGAKHFVRMGFEGASVEAIAESAGFSRGAFYANFDSKHELFLVLLESHLADKSAALAGVLDASLSAEDRLAEARQLFIGLPKNRDWIALTIEFQLYCMRHRAVLPKLAVVFSRHRKRLEGAIGRLFAQTGRSLPMPAATLATATMAISQGVALQYWIHPSSPSTQILTWFFDQAVDASPALHHRDRGSGSHI